MTSAGVFCGRWFQTAEINAVLAWAQRHGFFSGVRNVVIDAGCIPIGTTCIPMVRAAVCRALAIEPVAGNFSWLRKNVESNACADRILYYGLSLIPIWIGCFFLTMTRS